MRRRILCCLTIAALAGAGGCSVLDPHRRPDAARADTVKYADGEFAGNLGPAIDRANTLRETYYRAVREQSVTRNAIGLSLIPLSASALYLGFASAANSELAAGLGLGAAGMYGIGNFLHSAPRQGVYLQGSRALGCAVMAMRPVLYTQPDYTGLVNALQRATDGPGAVTEKANALRALLAGLNDLRVRAEIEAAIELAPAIDFATRTGEAAGSELDRARVLLDQLATTRAEALLLKRRIDTAGVTLDKTVEDIATKVSDEILKTEPDLASVMNVANNLGGWAGQFGSVPRVVAQGGAAAAAAAGDPGAIAKAQSGTLHERLGNELASMTERVAEATAELQAERIALGAATQTLADHVTAASELAKGSATLTDCNIAPVDLGFSIFPDVQSIELVQGATAVVSVTDRSGIPLIALEPANPEVGLALESPAGFISARITGRPDAVPGSQYTLHIANATRRDVRAITITVKETTSPPPITPATAVADVATTGPPGCRAEAVAAGSWRDWLRPSEQQFLTTLADVHTLQAALKVAVDGCTGSETRARIAAYQKAQQVCDDAFTDIPEAELETLTEEGFNKLVSGQPGC